MPETSLLLLESTSEHCPLLLPNSAALQAKCVFLLSVFDVSEDLSLKGSEQSQEGNFL